MNKMIYNHSQTEKTNNHIYLLLENNKLISFEWNKKTNPLRKYITENKQGPLINYF